MAPQTAPAGYTQYVTVTVRSNFRRGMPHRSAQPDGVDRARPEWFAAFLADRGTRKPSAHTLKAYRQDFDAIAALMADDPQDLVRLPLAIIDTEAMRSAFAEYARTHEAASIRRCWSTWNVLCTYLYTAELIAANPMPMIGRPKQPKSLPKSLPADAVTALLAAVSGAAATALDRLARAGPRPLAPTRLASGELTRWAHFDSFGQQGREPSVAVAGCVPMEPRGHELRSARVEPFGAEVIAGVAAQLMKEHRLGSCVPVPEWVYGIHTAPICSEPTNELFRRQSCQRILGLEPCEDILCTIAHLRAGPVSVFDGGCVGVVDEEVDDVAMPLGHRAVGHCAGDASPVENVTEGPSMDIAVVREIEGTGSIFENLFVDSHRRELGFDEVEHPLIPDTEFVAQDVGSVRPEGVLQRR